MEIASDYNCNRLKIRHLCIHQLGVIRLKNNLPLNNKINFIHNITCSLFFDSGTFKPHHLGNVGKSMIVYSEKIVSFISEIKKIVKEILTKEIGLKVYGDRFFNKKQNCSYPICIVVYNNKSMLGYFDPEFYELGFHECLMQNKSQLPNIIRHELAHYMTYIDYGALAHPHGEEFKLFCSKMRWDEEVKKASICLENLETPILEETQILRKIKKLIALANSSNVNEAEAAMLKSQQLLLKHHLESENLVDAFEEKILLKRVLSQKKQNAKLRSIAKILETFFVNTIFHKGKNSIHLEIIGDKTNIEIAEYVANVLEIELENLWNIARQKHAHLKGQTAKNSFFLGVAKGYCNKLSSLKRNYNQETTHAVMVIEKKLQQAERMIYPRLSTSKSQANYCKKSSQLGEAAGKSLNINQAVSQSNNGRFLIS